MMMKKIMNFKSLAMGLAVASLGLAACSDAFLEEKKDLDRVSPIIYDDFEGAEGRVNDCYSWSLLGAKSYDNQAIQSKGMTFGGSDYLSQTTEEYVGLCDWVNPEYNMNNVNYEGKKMPYDYFQGAAGNVTQSPYGRIRNFNDMIRGISEGSLSQEEKDMLLGQVHFWRAWAYYQLVKWHGGVPIVTDVLDPIEGPGTPRSSAEECFQFIFDELDLSAQLLEAATGQGGWAEASDWGRVTTASALALKGRLMNLWASPMFNRQNDISRWEAAYQFISESLPKIQACGHGLVDGSTKTAAGWADIFARTDRNPEAVLVQLFNTFDGETNDSADETIVLNSGWEHSIRPKNTGGGGGLQPSQMIIDLFPMKDGKVPSAASNYTTLGVSEIEYDEACPWMNRDPRFYRTFAFPGVRWTMNGDPSSYSASNWKGNEYECWSYVWYLKDDASKINEFRSSSNHGPDGLNGSAKGFYVRKRTCDNDVSGANYLYTGSFRRSAAPYLEIRYTEVLLNLAEAAAGANKLDVAVDQLRQIRSRVGYTGDCGIANGMSQGQTMAAVLYERMIELAFEGKRFEDARRWMLFDGGAEIPAGAPATWNVSGWGGNTCTWLGIAPLNGKRRENYEFHITYDAGMGAGIGEDLTNGDPLTIVAGIARPAAIDFRQEGEALTAQFDALKAWYGQYLACKIYSGDAYNEETGIDYAITWRPHYYFVGFRKPESLEKFEQTIGWDKTDGSWGTFDPLAANTAQ